MITSVVPADPPRPAQAVEAPAVRTADGVLPEERAAAAAPTRCGGATR
ncbi:hypothetical protein [Kitasatospora fiedleri]|nr:hypothetical protein [Kitasatospora fiedleri]